VMAAPVHRIVIGDSIMATTLPGSKFGEGIGGTVSVVEDPNAPSFDPSTHRSGTDEKIKFLLADHTIHLLDEWERQFLIDVYGKVPLTKKQHLRVSSIYRKHTQPAESLSVDQSR